MSENYAIKMESSNGYIIATKAKVRRHIIVWRGLSVFFGVFFVNILVAISFAPRKDLSLAVSVAIFSLLPLALTFFCWLRSNEWKGPETKHGVDD